MNSLITEQKENGKQKCAFDLILPTINEFPIEDNILISLKEQTEIDFRVIVIDQGEKVFDFSLLDPFSYLYIKISKRGLCLARNIAMEYLQGKYVSILDDDASLDKFYLAKLKDLFVSQKYVGICGLIIDPKSDKPYARSVRETNKTFLLNKKDFPYCISAALSFRTSVKTRFDEELGLGARFGSGEEADFFLSLIREGQVYYDPSLKVYHDNDSEKIKSMSYRQVFNRGKSYGSGNGAVCKKAWKKYGESVFIFYFLRNVSFSVLGGLLNLFKLNFKMILRDYGSFVGKFEGFFLYKSN